jgi:superoxide dismutase, Cu-Zn family
MRLMAPLVAIMTIASIACLGAGSALAEQERVRITLITSDGIGATIGTIHVVDTKQGLRLTPLLKSLDPGTHDIGIQENGDCGPGPIDGTNAAGGAAGRNFDANQTTKPEGAPDTARHGELPPLTVGNDGIARTPITVENLKLAQIRGRAVVIYAEGGAKPGSPAPSGGTRVACGVVR